MHSTDREQFDVQLSMLCQGYGSWVGDKAEGYWKGLAKMSLPAFARCVEYALGEDGPEKLPNTHAVWAIYRKLRTSASHDVVAESNPPEQGKWLLWVNGLFLHYLKRRRLREDFTGDINIDARRAMCLQLAEFFGAIAAEGDPDATEAELTKRFHVAMARIPDGAPAAVALELFA